YIFINNTTDLELRFNPIIQLCYYDGANDLNHWTHNLAVTTNYPIFTFVPGWKEYDHTVASEMMYFPPLTTETITTIPGMNLPADPTGPTTATGQYFSFSVPMTSNEIDLYTQYGKLAAIEGMVIDPITNVTTLSTAIRFPFGGPTGPTSPTGPWLPVPSAPNLVYHQITLEVCMLNVAGGWYGLPSERIFGYNSKNYKWSAYTTLSEVVVVLEEI